MFNQLKGQKFAALLVDPPWKFAVRSAKGEGRSASRHYDTMTHSDLLALPFDEICAPDCVMFLWVIDTHIPQALELVQAWGFTYKTVGFYWGKQNRDGTPFMGGGFWTRANPEQCWLLTRGRPKRVSKSVRRWICSVRREHSRKPEEIYERIEALVEGPYLELFARTQRPNWCSWGDQTMKFQPEKKSTAKETT